MNDISTSEMKHPFRRNLILMLAWLAVVTASAVVLFGNLRFGANVLAVGFEDDFFYYAQIARNLALHGISSFDGIHHTNGYHPLWLLVLTAVMKFFSQGGILGAKTVFPLAIALECIQFVIEITISFFVYRLVRIYCSRPVSVCVMLLQVSFSLVLVRTGMEVGLTLALAFAWLWFRLRPEFSWSLRNSFILGLLGSFCILSRLDAILLIGLVVLFDTAWRKNGFRAAASYVLLFAIGLIPFAVYLPINHFYFGTLTPISGLAKQLRMHHLPSVSGLESFVGYFTAAGSPLLAPIILLTLCAIIALAYSSQTARKSAGIMLAILIFPFVHLLTITTLSDWKLWPWYLYPWIVSGVAAAIVLFSLKRFPERPSDSRIAQISEIFAILFLLSYAGAVAKSSDPRHNLTYAVGLELKDFSKQHPGIYAMGDRSGAVGFLMDQPVIQLEGLTMDKAYLQNIRQERPLKKVLRQYGVDYYISTRSSPENNCYPVKEPWQAGPDSPSMHALLCQTPLATFKHGTFVNHVFDMRTQAVQ